MQHVIALLVILITMLISGCSTCEQSIEHVYVPQKCVVPETEEPILNNAKCDKLDYNCAVVKVLSNYEAMKRYAELLKYNSEACK